MDTDTIRQRLLDNLGDIEVDYCNWLLIDSLAIITSKIHNDPEKALPSMIAQQRQLIRAYQALQSRDNSFFL